MEIDQLPPVKKQFGCLKYPPNKTKNVFVNPLFVQTGIAIRLRGEGLSVVLCKKKNYEKMSAHRILGQASVVTL